MKKREENMTDLQECADKIDAILDEYRCSIVFDQELEEVIVHDLDTKLFTYLTE